MYKYIYIYTYNMCISYNAKFRLITPLEGQNQLRRFFEGSPDQSPAQTSQNYKFIKSHQIFVRFHWF